METHDLEFMYQGGETYHFMNTENYDQIEMDEEALGDSAQWMQPGMRIQAEYYNGRPIGIQLPNSLMLEVTDTAPVMKSATKTASTKPAKLENGVTVNVPEFVRPGRKSVSIRRPGSTSIARSSCAHGDSSESVGNRAACGVIDSSVGADYDRMGSGVDSRASPAVALVTVAQLVRAPDCGSGGCGFNSHQSP